MSNDLSNLMVWFNYDDEGNIERISQLSAVPSKYSLDAYFELWRAGSAHMAENVYTFTKEHIVVPDHLMGVEGVAFIMHYNGKKIKAILPYFVMISED